MTTSALDRRVGADALVLTIGVTVVPGTEHGAVVIRGGRADTDRRPESATLTVEVTAESLPELPTIGTPVTCQLGADAIAYFALAGDELEAARWRFAGVVTDPAVTAAGVVSITATGRRAQLGRKRIGDEPWPAESDGARAARILALAGAGGQQSVDGTSLAGWGQPIFGATVPPAVLDALGIKVTWDAGAGNSIYARGYGTGVAGSGEDLIVGKTYTALLEVYVPTGSSPVQIDAVFIGRSAPIPPAERWQTVTHTWTETGGGVRAVGLAVAGVDAGGVSPRPAGLTVFIRRFTLYESDAPIVAGVDPGTVAVLARDVDRRYALELLDALAVDSQAELVELRDGRLEWHDALHRDADDPDVELTADQLLDDLVWAQTLAGLVNDLVVEYGEPDVDDVRPTVRIVDEVSAGDPNIGPAEATLSTQLAAEVDAQTLAVTTVGRRSRPTWQLDGVAVDLLRTLDPATARKVLGLEFGDLVAVAGQPASAPLRSGRLWVEGWTETITRKAWRMAFDVSDYGATGPPIRWADVDADLSWSDVPASISWLGATSWRPPHSTAGRWTDGPARLRWTDLDPAVTWSTYTD